MNPAIVLSLLAGTAPTSDTIVRHVQSVLPRMNLDRVSGTEKSERQVIIFKRSDNVRLTIRVERLDKPVPKPGTKESSAFLAGLSSSGQEMPSGYRCGQYALWNLGPGGYHIQTYSAGSIIALKVTAPIRRAPGQARPQRIAIADFPEPVLVESMCRHILGYVVAREGSGTKVSSFTKRENGFLFESTKLSMKVPIGSNVAFVKGKKVDLGGFAGVSAKGELVLPSAYVKKYLSGKAAR